MRPQILLPTILALPRRLTWTWGTARLLRRLCVPLALPACLLGQAQETRPPVAAQAPSWEYAPSILALPIRVHLDPIFQEAERTAPRVPPGVETWTPLPDSPKGPAHFRFNLYRDPLAFTHRGRRLSVQANVHYWLQVGLGVPGYVSPVAACGLGTEGHREARLGVEAEFGLTPAWDLDLRIRPLDPVGLNPCRITFLNYDITPKVLAGMKDTLAKAATDIERQVGATLRLRERADAVWQQVREPIPLAEGVWLVLNPERIRVGPFASEGRTLVITPEIQARPALHLGDRPSTVWRALPALEPSPLPLAPGFRVRLEGSLPFAQATAQIQKQMAGRTFETEKGTFKILDAAIRGEGDRAIVEVTLQGRINGKLSLAGRPAFNPATGTLRIEGLDYTLESRNWITKVGEWLFRSTLRKTLAEQTGLFLDRSFQDMKTLVNQGLNRPLGPGLRMKGDLRDLKMGTPKILEDRFLIEAFLEGTAEVQAGTS